MSEATIANESSKADKLALAEAMQKLLANGLVEMGLEIDAEKQQKLLDYVALIHKWNQVHNLTAVRDPLDMVTLHLLDSLSILPYITCSNLLDVGAGAGLPSIPLAICLPNLQVTAIDAVQKKVSFMRQAKAQLRLTNFNVVHGRIEDQEAGQLMLGKGIEEKGGANSSDLANQPANHPPKKFEVITSRAFSEIALFIKLTKHLLADGGQWLAMKGVIPEREFERAGITPAEVKVLKVAGLNAERHLIVINALS